MYHSCSFFGILDICFNIHKTKHESSSRFKTFFFLRWSDSAEVTFYYKIVTLFPGYGFVDFETIASAEAAVKGLQAKGVQAQMAKVGIWFLRRLNRVRCACK